MKRVFVHPRTLAADNYRAADDGEQRRVPWVHYVGPFRNAPAQDSLMNIKTYDHNTVRFGLSVVDSRHGEKEFPC